MVNNMYLSPYGSVGCFQIRHELFLAFGRHSVCGRPRVVSGSVFATGAERLSGIRCRQKSLIVLEGAVAEAEREPLA